MGEARPGGRRGGARRAGVNDLGGTLMNESISRSAGSEHGQEMSPEAMEALIRASGRDAAPADDALRRGAAERRAASFGAAPLAEPLNPHVREARLQAPPRLARPGSRHRADPRASLRVRSVLGELER